MSNLPLSTRSLRRVFPALLIVAVLSSSLPPVARPFQPAALKAGTPASQHVQPLTGVRPAEAAPEVAAETLTPQIGFLRLPVEVDVDGNPASNPTTGTPVPVVRLGPVDSANTVKHATIVLAAEVVPEPAGNAPRNPAGTMVDFHLWSDDGQGCATENACVDVVRTARADAWGAAYVEILLDDLHLAGRFHYTASAPGYGQTAERTFTVDANQYSQDIQLGAAQVTAHVEQDGQLVVDVESIVPIDDKVTAVEITAVRLTPNPEGGDSPDRTVLPTLYARRIDDHHAQAQLYVEPGSYMVAAAVTSGVIEARSAPTFVAVDHVVAPPVGRVEQLAGVSEDGASALVQYRTPDGDVALLTRSLDDLPSGMTADPAPAFQETIRVSPFSWRTLTYSTTVQTVSGDPRKSAVVDGFAYDPVARSYDVTIESRLDQPMEDKLTVQVLGPHGVVIFEETVPIWLDPAQPFTYQVNVPTDLGEPHGLRLIIHDPNVFQWAIEVVSDSVSSVFRTLRGKPLERTGFSLEASFGFSIKVVEIDIATASIVCNSDINGCFVPDPKGLIFNPGDWYNTVTNGVRDWLRARYRDITSVDTMDDILKKVSEGIPLGNLTVSVKLGGKYTYVLVNPSSCLSPQQLQAAKDYVKNVGSSLSLLGKAITFQGKTVSEYLQGKDKFRFTVPAIWWLGVEIGPVLAFKVEGDKFGDYAIYGQLLLEIGGKAELKLKASAILDTLASVLEASNYFTGVYKAVELAKLAEQLFKLIDATSKYAAQGNGCPGGRGRNGNPPPPNGAPDDRRDAYQNELIGLPTGASGDLQVLQQQVAAAEQAGLQRAVIYFNHQLRIQELLAFELDSQRAISHTQEIDDLTAAAQVQISGLISGTILPPPGQTVTDAVRSAYTDFMMDLGETSVDVERRALLDAADFAQRQYNGLRGQELALQHELRQLLASSGVGVLNSGLVTWALTAVGSLGVRAVPINILPLESDGTDVRGARYVSPAEAPPVVIVPSGGLYRLRGSQQAIAWLDTYVAAGGTLVVLTQFDSPDWEMLPGGEVRGLGYEQDILCRTASVRVVNASPWIAGIGRDLPDIQVDGSFTAWPDNATILLMRTTGNMMPAMIEYDYGLGHVVATAAYPDFYINGMQSHDDIAFARNLFGLAYLEATSETLAASGTPGQPISFSTVFTNTTSAPVTKVSVFRDYYDGQIGDSWRWAAHAPDSGTPSQVIPLNPPLEPGQSRSVTLNFTAPPVTGIVRIGFFLGTTGYWYLSGGIPGPFYQVVSPAVPTDLFNFRLRPEYPDYGFGATANVIATVRNDRTTSRTITLKPAQGLSSAPVTLVVPPQATAVQTFTTVADTTREVRVQAFDSGNTLISELATTLRAKSPNLNLAVSPIEMVVGVGANGHFTVTTTAAAAGVPLDWTVRQDGAPLQATTTPLVAGPGYRTASLSVALPAAQVGARFTVRAALPGPGGAITQTIPVQPPAYVTSAGLDPTVPLVIGQTAADAVRATLRDFGLPGTAHMQALVRQNNTTLSAGPVVSRGIGAGNQNVDLSLSLPSSLDLELDYQIVISTTSQVAGGTEVYSDTFQLAQALPLAAPDTALLPGPRVVRQPLTMRILALNNTVALPASGPFTVTLRGLANGFVDTSFGNSATPGSGSLLLTTTLPDTIDTAGDYTMEVGSPKLLGWTAVEPFHLAEPAIVYGLPATASAGAALSWTAQNSGGIDTSLKGTVTLYDPSFVPVDRVDVDTALLAGASTNVTLQLPGQGVNGPYAVVWRGQDHAGKTLHDSRLVSVSGGLAVSLDSQTDRQAYLPGDAVDTTTGIDTSGPLADAWLRLQVVKPLDPATPNAAVKPLGPQQSPPAPLTPAAMADETQSLRAGSEAQVAQERNITRPDRQAFRTRALARRDQARAGFDQRMSEMERQIRMDLSQASSALLGTTSLRSELTSLSTYQSLALTTICPLPGSGAMVSTPSGDVTWTAAGSPYIVEGAITIPATATLTVEPGAVIKFADGASLEVQGAFVTPSGGPAAILTSIHDDSVGGDSDLLDVTPQAGDWEWIYLSGSQARTARHLDVRYGRWLSSDGDLTLTDSSFLQMSDGVVVNSTGASLIARNRFDDILSVYFSDTTTGVQVFDTVWVNNLQSYGGVVFDGVAVQASVHDNQWLDGVSGTAIHFNDGYSAQPNDQIVLQNNVFRHIRSGDTGGCCAGINFWGATTNVDLTGNVVQDVDATPEGGCCHGVNFWDDAAGVAMTGNVFQDFVTTDGSCCDGVNFWSLAVDITLDGNRLLRLPLQPPVDGYGPCCSGVQFWDDASTVIIRNNELADAWGYYNGFDFWNNAEHLVIENNRLTDSTLWNGTSPGDGYGNSFEFWGDIDDFQIRNNVFSGAAQWDNGGLQFWGASSNGHVTDNRLEKMRDGLNGIMFWDSADHVTVARNTLSDFSAVDDPYPDQGIAFWGGGSFLAVTDNAIERTMAGAIFADGPISDSQFVRNRIREGNGALAGIRLLKGAVRTDITDNVISDFGADNGTETYDGYHGIMVRTDWFNSSSLNQDVEIARNTLARLSGPGSGIFVASKPGVTHSENVIVKENLIYDSPQGGIHLMGDTTNAAVSFNVSARNRFGLWLLGTGAGVTASNNTLVENGASSVALYAGQTPFDLQFGRPYNLAAHDTLLTFGSGVDYGAASPTIKNSLLIDGGGYDVRGEGTAALAPILRYNDAFGAATPGVTLDAGGTVTPLTTYDASNIGGDPRFVSPAVGNYRLAGDSPAVDAGDPADVDPGTSSRADLGALVGSVGVLREEWIAVDGSGPLSYPLPLASPDLLDDPRAQGGLALEATLFSRDPAAALREERSILAVDSYPFLVADGASVALAAERLANRANVPSYTPDDAASTVTVRGVVRNIDTVPHTLTVDVTRGGTPLLNQSFADVPPGELRTFSVGDANPPVGTASYEATSSLGGSASAQVAVVAAQVTAAAAADPTHLALGQATTVELVLTNSGDQPSYVTADLGDGPQDLIVPAGGSTSLSAEVTPGSPGAITLPVALTGDLNQTLAVPVTVHDETATATLALGGVIRNATTLVQGHSASLLVDLEVPGDNSFTVEIDYAVTGPVNRSGSLLRIARPGQNTERITLGMLPVGDYDATITVHHQGLGTQLANLPLAFSVVEPQHTLLLDASAGEMDSAGTVVVTILAGSDSTSDGPWSGTLTLAGVLGESVALTLEPCQFETVQRTVALKDLSGPQTLDLTLADSSGNIVATKHLVLQAAPRQAPLASLGSLDIGPAVAGNAVVITSTIANTGPAGEIFLNVTAFGQSYDVVGTVDAGDASLRGPESMSHTPIPVTVPVPADLLQGTYPVVVRLGDQEARGDVAVQGAQVTLSRSLNAASYAALSPATWTIVLHGVSGGPATYDVELRYGDQNHTQTVSVGAGQNATVPWTFTTGRVSDRATVLVHNHAASSADQRFALIIDSQIVPVVEDSRAWLESDKTSYVAGETVNLTLHLLQPARVAAVLPPSEFSADEPLLWSSLSLTPTLTITNPYALGDYAIPFVLPDTVRTGRYFFTYFFDGEERSLPIDVHGVVLKTEQFTVSGSTQRAKQPGGVPLTIKAQVRLEAALPNVTLMAYAVSPGGEIVSLGPTAITTTNLPAGVSEIVLNGMLNAVVAGPYQIMLKILDSATQLTLGGDAAFVDVGGASIVDLSTDHALYTQNQTGIGALTVYGQDTATVEVRTSGGATLLNQALTLSGYTTLPFVVPTASQGDEVLIGTVTDSSGMTSTLQTAYKVAAALDTTAPEVEITSPINGSSVTRTGANQVAVSGVFTEDVAIDTVLVNGMPATLSANTWSVTLPLEMGDNLLTAMALDAAGNQSMPDMIAVVGQPAYGITFSAAPNPATVNQPVTFTAVITSSQRMTATVLFPFSSFNLSLGASTATTGTVSMGPPVTWQGVVTPAQPVTIQWQGSPTKAESRTVSGLVQGPQMLPKVSPEIDLVVQSGALAVTLASFTATVDGDLVRLDWETVSEMDHLGFNLDRGESRDGPWMRLNADLILSPSPGSASGYIYQWEDPVCPCQTGRVFWYRLEAVDLSGATETAGLVSVDPGEPASLGLTTWLPLIVD